MSERHCQTCKWWGKLAYNDNHPWHATARICGHPKPLFDLCWEGCSYLATQPEFGCVHWEAGISDARKQEQQR